MTSRSSANFSSDLSLRNQSLEILDAVAPWAIVQVCLSTSQLLSSLIIFIVIILTRNLRDNQTFVILCHVVANDALLSVGNLCICSHRLQSFLKRLPVPSTARWCLYQDLPRLYCYTNSNGFLLLLAVNRLVAVAAPVWYQHGRARRLFRILIIAMYVRSAAMCTMYAVGTGNVTEPVPLCPALPIQSWASKVLTMVSVSWTVSTALIYLAAVVTTHLRLAIVSKKRDGGSVTEARKQLEVQVVWTLALILLTHISTTTVGNAIMVFAANSRAEGHWRRNYVAYTGSSSLIASNTVLYLLILLCRCTTFRRGFLGLWLTAIFWKERPSAVELQSGQQQSAAKRLHNVRSDEEPLS